VAQDNSKSHDAWESEVVDAEPVDSSYSDLRPQRDNDVQPRRYDPPVRQVKGMQAIIEAAEARRQQEARWGRPKALPQPVNIYDGLNG
jgi:hypothetical protein